MKTASFDSEKYSERSFVKFVTAAGGIYIKMVATERGLPDRLVLLPGGHSLLIEFKSKGKKPAKIQLWQHSRLIEIGHRCFVVSNEEEYNKAVEYVKYLCTKTVPAESL